MGDYNRANPYLSKGMDMLKQMEGMVTGWEVSSFFISRNSHWILLIRFFKGEVLQVLDGYKGGRFFWIC